ncbi:3-hydroxybutyrate oligomer hydrolase family protein [Gilliamella apicola]|uniref:3-hydroxybutyrate oligomer hydrolase family protein n=1 Tax=Gilliamella apicola TaxID=1196095 RepID=UPI002FEE5D90
MRIKNIKIKILVSLICFTSTIIPFVAQAKSDSRLSISREDMDPIEYPTGITIESSTNYDGETDDLVTAGLGFTALSTLIIKPTIADPERPTTQELRKLKLNRFIDTKTGEGTLFGFQRKNLTPLFDGRIAGTEILATFENNKERIGLLVQIPLDFDKNKPCIVAVPSTNSDGLFNAYDVQIRGLWGLRHNCAVVYNDKGLGNGIYDITNQYGFTIDGKIKSDNLLFEPKIKNREQYVKTYPDRYAIKQLHSKQNSEERWGEYVLKSIEFAFHQINTHFSETQKVIFDKDNTLVLVYGASDGAGAALKAGELDKNNTIKGIVAVNPQIAPYSETIPVTVKVGEKPPTKIEYLSIAEYSTYASLYIPCAVPAIISNNKDNNLPFADNYTYAQNRCDALKKAQLLIHGTPKEALEKLRQYGWTPEMDRQLPYFYFKETVALPYQYISAYGRYDVIEDMCNYSVASTQKNPILYVGKVEPLSEIEFQQLWGLANGQLPVWLGDESTMLALVNNQDMHSPRRDFYSSSDSKAEIDYNSKGAICLYNKLKDTRVKNGMKQVSASANLNGIKTFIIHGRNNVKQLPNYTSRAYVALNSKVEGNNSQLRYIEVKNSSYLEGKPPFDNSLVSIDYYGEDAMEWLWANLTNNATLPDSQVIHAKPRVGKVTLTPDATAQNLVPILQSPNRNDIIKKQNGELIIPN